ncbi:hypothetical protein B4064_2342 [Caldibacillus thermoamylovorans]|nr:hypothetical protein B4065_3092 [Caldibacillus thermoamylovorans]KIO66154.1 hypothetical protein B4064_2342 [Caldibacillus thermoamylovorans]
MKESQLKNVVKKYSIWGKLPDKWDFPFSPTVFLKKLKTSL